MHIDYSGLRAWKQCRVAHHFQYTEQWEPKRPQLDSFLGTAVHYALYRWYTSDELILDAFRREFMRLYSEVQSQYTFTPRDTEEMLSLYTLGAGMLSHYEETHDGEQDFTVVVGEYRFAVPIAGTDGVFQGRVDGVIVDEDNALWIVEHKTTKTFPDDRFLVLDEQSLLYQWAMQQVIASGQIAAIPSDAILAGWCYNGLRRAVPKEPALLKNGKSLSIAHLDTTERVYRLALHHAGFLVEDYEEKLTELHNRGNTFFKRNYVQRMPREVATVQERLSSEYQSFCADRHHVYPNLSRLCASCDYYDPCLERQRHGRDSWVVQDILQQLYKKRDHHLSDRLSSQSDTIGSLSIGEENETV